MNEAAAIGRALYGRPAGDGWLVRPVSGYTQGLGDRHPSLLICDGDIPGRVLVRCFVGCDPLDILAALDPEGSA
jgi:hypothetical protein